jgi:hypothetical protein
MLDMSESINSFSKLFIKYIISNLCSLMKTEDGDYFTSGIWIISHQEFGLFLSKYFLKVP